ncbi:DedA family protein [Romboutsia lituseburensis]|uniref:DedA family protein n=1 Tax=Romboutsia lituseburensis TaxID=1537 RepID=UPI00215B5CE2|nr:DedA family protein [Romboutsia lituseburensis]MCR8744874.1 DedA family protein [Romboutsia lituseburensis]
MELSVFVENLIRDYGLISIFVIVALEYANAPLPSEIVLPFAGILSLKFGMNLPSVIFISILGGILGSIINYYLGYKIGNPLIDFLKRKYPKTKKSIKTSYKWITKYDKISVMISRLVPLARTFISIVAGVTKMNIVAFMLYSTIGISIWNTILISMGYIVGNNMILIGNILSKYSIFIGIIIVMISGYLIKKK